MPHYEVDYLCWGLDYCLQSPPMRATEFHLITDWVFDALIEAVWRALYAPEECPHSGPAVVNVERIAEGDANGIRAVRRMTQRTHCPKAKASVRTRRFHRRGLRLNSTELSRYAVSKRKLHLEGTGMTISATAVRFDEHRMWVDLSDGRVLGVPLAWFPRLLDASPDARARVEISRTGLHWEDLDEDISIAGLIAERGDMTRLAQRAV